jgi:hypothetical protein
MPQSAPQDSRQWPMIAWTSVIAPLILLIVGGIGGAIYTRITAPDAPSVRAVLHWVDVDNPKRIALSLNTKLISELDSSLKAAFGVNGLAQFITGQYDPRIRIGVLKLSNDSNVRSRPIEVAVDSSMLFSKDAVEPSSSVVSQMKLKPIDPQKDAIVYIIASPWSPFLTFPVRVLHDDRVVEIVDRAGSETPAALLHFFNRYPFLGFGFFMLCLLGGAMVIFGLPLNLLTTYNIRFRAWGTTLAETKRLLALIDYLRIHYPEKMPKTPTSGSQPSSEAGSL